MSKRGRKDRNRSPTGKAAVMTVEGCSARGAKIGENMTRNRPSRPLQISSHETLRNYKRKSHQLTAEGLVGGTLTTGHSRLPQE